MNVVGQLRTGPQAFPQSIVLDPSNGRPVSLLVVCASARGTLDVVREGAEAAPLIVEEGGARRESTPARRHDSEGLCTRSFRGQNLDHDQSARNLGEAVRAG